MPESNSKRNFVLCIGIVATATPKDSHAFWFFLRGIGGLARGGLRGGARGGMRGGGTRGGRANGVASSVDVIEAFNQVHSPLARSAGVTTSEFVFHGRYNNMGVHLSNRHFYGKLNRPNSSGNCVYTGESAAPIVRDFEGIVSGRVKRLGEEFHTPSGRVWRWERNPTEGINNLYPVRGPNIVNLNSFEYNMLRKVQDRGIAEVMTEMEFLRQRSLITNESYIQLRSLIAIFEG